MSSTVSPVSPTPLELLAPARDVDTAMAAIDCGADAVYIGGPHHGARAAASNTVDDLRRLCDYAHRYRARVYVTFNTIIYNDELDDCRRAVADLYRAGVDALIVQDMSLLRMDIPPIALHASTQCDTRTPERARFLEDVGMSCIVLPREMTLDEIRAVRRATTVRLEGFVHGALCVCYSGDCRASLVNGGRSANRGECAQICRLPYDLTDDKGNIIVADRHLLSLRDMNRLAHLAQMADAGISSFKIEGRLKDKAYVMNTVTAYSRALDDLCAASPDRWCRSSAGRTVTTVAADVDKAFNRGFTSYFLTGTQPAPHSLGSHLTPKFTGPAVARVKNVRGRTLTVSTLGGALHNGDGLCFVDGSGRFTGFRVNRVEGNTLHLSAPVSIPVGAVLHRNADKAFDDALQSAVSKRVIDVDFTLDATATGIALTVSDTRGCTAVSAMDCTLDAARTDQHSQRRDILGRLGDTIYAMRGCTDNLGQVFVPAKTLTALRRQALDALDHAAAATRPVEYRRPEKADAVFDSDRLTFHNNVSNRLADQFYREHGVTDIKPALETQPADDTADAEVHVMTTRYCLRRELGACLKTADAGRLPRTLVLRPAKGAPDIRPMRLTFDCANCRMLVHALPRK